MMEVKSKCHSHFDHKSGFGYLNTLLLTCQIHLLPEESRAHRPRVENIHLIVIAHHHQRGLRTGTIPTLTSHLHEKNPREVELQILTSLLHGNNQKQDEALILTSHHQGGGHRRATIQMKIYRRLVGPASHR